MKTGNVFVAMFDIIGFKNLRKQRESSGLYELYTKVFYPKYSTQQHSKAR